ncbi:hypothetical protein SAMN05444397_109195 [Flavobacterium aquidurense]|uniref:Uncharacterized protein n=1 Tax=Flavobacterium frigidimaris TaxID=262320 RepID=A0ABX4BUS3_FLAFR|nr:hypothetical protein [Flavobacterium frigidimaris]OXA81095.1 hypothetical protein B0A65_04950 [Flavobacterium frigidimaris]SDZ58533.1 hypothetical protein SAMN05444397_109195 [Flavobacterium aquidurense]
MEEIAEQRLIIDIDLAPNVDDVYTGKCLVANSEIVMLLNFDEENGKFDGYTIVKNSDVEKYRTWEEKDYAELKNDNSESLVANINLNDFTDLEKSLKSLVSEIVSIFAYDDEDSFLVGKILWATNDSVELHLIDKDSNWSENEIIKLSDISYLGFDTEYEREIKKNVV